MHPDITVVNTVQEIFQAGASLFVQIANESIRKNGRCTVVLSGGSTPKGLFSLLATDSWKTQVDWEKVYFFWGDERHVGPDHPDSNYKMAYDSLISKLAIPSGNVHRMKGESDNPDLAAQEYEHLIRKFFVLRENEFPVFDLVFLGMGPDGHTASLFPGTKALQETRHLVVSNWVGKFNTHRITMTAPVFNHASSVVFLVSGQDKAAPLKAVLEGPYEPEQLPAQLIQPLNGRLTWLLEKASAELLGNR